MKRKIIIIISLIIIILALITTVFLVYTNNTKFKLKNIGYNNLETKEILNLTDKEINIILDHDYNKNLIYIITSNNYDHKKLELYLKYINKNKDVDYLKIFNLINNKDTDIKKINDYINLLKRFDNLEGVIKYINNYKDLNLELNDTILLLINEEYFIIDYLDRYLKYYENNKDLDFKEIITRVNSNLDYKFYDDANKADTSKGMYTLVNKYYYLEDNFIPDNLEKVNYEYAINNTKLNKMALENFITMANTAKENNLFIKITTAYRDYNFQNTLYNNYVRSDGVELADTYSARAGYSEHQLGYSVDLTNNNYSNFEEFENTKEYEWLQTNAHKYGFILRYPKEKEYITGYQFESWHYRYVGTEVATYIYENNITYEEYYSYFLR